MSENAEVSSKLITDDTMDEELRELKRMKSELLAKSNILGKQIRDWERGVKIQESNTHEDNSSEEDEEYLFDAHETEKEEPIDKQCFLITEYIFGAKFHTIDKNWIRPNVWSYTTSIRSQYSDFFLKITVDCKDDRKKFEVLDIECRSKSTSQCYDVECASWIDYLTKAMKLSHLMTAISDYIEHNQVRGRILKKLMKSPISTISGNLEDGGILIRLHAADNPNVVYLSILWTIEFVEKSWKIDNSFIIKPIAAGQKFLKSNEELLRNFCRRNLKPTDLVDQWSQLLGATANIADFSATDSSSE